MKSEYVFLLWKELQELRKLLASQDTGAIEELFLDSAQVKQLLHISDSTLYRLRKKKAIPFVNFEGRYYYPKQLLTVALLEKIIPKVDASKRFDDP